SRGARPRSRAVPEVGRRRPKIRLIAVVLSAPVGPNRPTSSPGRTARLTPAKAWTLPKVLQASTSSTTGPEVAGSAEAVDTWELAVEPGIVETVADHESVRDDEAGEVDVDGDLAPGRAVEEGGRAGAGGACAGRA